MALGVCKECKNEVSSGAKTCPHCGMKKPYRPAPSKQGESEGSSTSDKVQAVLYGGLILVIIMFFIGQPGKEERLLEDLEELGDGQHEKKYEVYSELAEADSENDEYAAKAVRYGEQHLKTVPVERVQKNLSMYERLAELNPDSDYAGKVALYSFMDDVETDCRITAKRLSEQSVNNPSTYDSHWSGTRGEWVSSNEYRFVHSFEAQNAFGVVSEFTAHYLCEVDAQSEEYSVEQLALTKG